MYERLPGVGSVATAEELPLVGLSIDGQGYWERHGGNLTFAREVLKNKTVAKTLHALSVHPYARSKSASNPLGACDVPICSERVRCVYSFLPGH
jgi:hypothetical protein